MNEIRETVNDIAIDIACLMDEADDLVLSLEAVQDKLTRLQNTLSTSYQTIVNSSKKL